MGQGKNSAAMSGAMSGAAAGSTVGPWGAAIGAVAGGLGGYLMGSDDNSSDYYEKMLKAAEGIPLPILKEINPEAYKVVTSLNPEMDNALTLNSSAMEGVSTDPRLKQAQMSALSKLMNISDNDGMDAQFKADTNRLQNSINSNLKGNSDAIIQNMATRGMSGGTSELLQRQMAAQAASNQQAQVGMDINAQAQQRALKALMDSSNMAGNMDQQSFNQQSEVAKSQDAISRFNLQNRQTIQSNNLQNRNTAAASNAQNQQNTADRNVAQNNSAQEYNYGLAQKNYDNQLKKTGLINNANSEMARVSSANAAANNQMLGNTMSNAASAYASYKPQQENSSADKVANNNTMNKVTKWNPNTGRYE